MTRLELRSLMAVLLFTGIMFVCFDQQANSADCTYCKCADRTGVLVADVNEVFSSGWWYYERKANDDPGGPIENAAVKLHYTGVVTCIENEMSELTGTGIYRYKVQPPNPLPCTIPKGTVPAFGANMKYDAMALPKDAALEKFRQRKCIVPKGS